MVSNTSTSAVEPTAADAAAPVDEYPSPEELYAACAKIPGLHVLEVNSSNINDYCCGAFSLVERDLSVALSQALAVQVTGFLRELLVPEAFRTREELINYKKVLLHDYQQGLTLERSLAQLTAFFHGSDKEQRAGGHWCPSARLAELSDARMQCKGRCEASFDARLLGKQLCNLPRHVDKARSSVLDALPRSLRSWTIGSSAASALEDGLRANQQRGKCENQEDQREGAERGNDEQVVADEGFCAKVGVFGDSSHEAAFTSASTETARTLSSAEVVGLTKKSWHASVATAIANQLWPDHVKHFVRLVLLCRGADKALRMWDEVPRACQALEASLVQVERALDRLQQAPKVDEVAQRFEATSGSVPESCNDGSAAVEAKREMAASVMRQRHINLLTGCAPALRESLRWFRTIQTAAEVGAAQLFIAGDGREGGRVSALAGPPPPLCVPAGFTGSRTVDDNFRRVVLRYTPEMRQILSNSGWPASISSRRGQATAPEAKLEVVASEGAVAATNGNGPSSKVEKGVVTVSNAACGGVGSDAVVQGVDGRQPRSGQNRDERPPEKVCRVCDMEFSALWVQRGICCECEERVRVSGRCPFGVRCNPAGFCPHDHRCFVCDAHSCEACRLFRGDGEHVLDLVARIKPSRVALDFDRTLATTKSGALPVFGKHAVDMDLLSVLTIYDKQCIVVTRNSHSEEIGGFLRAHGAPDVPVQTLRRPKSKAEYVLSGLSQDARVVFVDDTIAELMDPRLANDDRVIRVLFVRGLF
eukprot:TRINITY_DN27623_c0_g1_i1.p1 TRINITY_DN27623_c0_g1~~TRINITY_DN27623_c0_g1_i1.p1  ORF type:complete len:763 (+),score=151.13 TRINITY_DN27623_c0_g1_i1:197-2485(+)